MHLIVRHKIFRFLSGAFFFNKLGASIYNIVFVSFAATMSHRELAVGVANVTMLLPVLFTVLAGIKADETKEKGTWLIRLGFVQALLFLVVALLTHQASWLAFSTVCLINVLSDVISDYRSGLEMPIIKKHVAEDDLMAAYSFQEVLTYLCQLGGQGLGVWLLTQSQDNYALVATVNAVFFLISSLILFFIRKELTYDKVEKADEPAVKNNRFKEMYRNLEQVFKESEAGHFGFLLLSVLLLNSVGGSIGAIFNIYFLTHSFYGLSYSQSLFAIQLLMFVATVIGSMTPNDYFAKRSITTMVKLGAATLVGVGLVTFLNLPLFLSLAGLCFIFYLAGKINPKLNSLLIANLPSDVLAQTSNFLGLLFTAAMPIGSLFFTSIAIYDVRFAWLGLATISLFSLVVAFYASKK